VGQLPGHLATELSGLTSACSLWSESCCKPAWDGPPQCALAGETPVERERQTIRQAPEAGIARRKVEKSSRRRARRFRLIHCLRWTSSPAHQPSTGTASNDLTGFSCHRGATASAVDTTMAHSAGVNPRMNPLEDHIRAKLLPVGLGWVNFPGHAADPCQSRPSRQGGSESTIVDRMLGAKQLEESALSNVASIRKRSA
jgi:hypothetical protein